MFSFLLVPVVGKKIRSGNFDDPGPDRQDAALQDATSDNEHMQHRGARSRMPADCNWVSAYDPAYPAGFSDNRNTNIAIENNKLMWLHLRWVAPGLIARDRVGAKLA